MRAIAGLVMLAALAAAPSVSHAGLMTPGDLVKDCSGDATAKATCDGYLMAVTDSIKQRENRGKATGKICLPDSVTIDQVRDSVIGFGKQRRAEHMPNGVRLVLAAMRSSWPCNGASRAR